MLVLAATAALFGCQATNKLVGVWEAEVMGMKATQTMNADNSFVQVMDIPMISGAKATTTGTWKLEADKLTITPKDVKFEGMPEQYKAMAETQKTQVIGKDQVATLAWKTDDEMVLTMNGQQQVFKRKK